MINKTNWEEEFDKEFPNSRGIFINNDKNNLRRNAIKSFFNSQLKQIRSKVLEIRGVSYEPKEAEGEGRMDAYNSAIENTLVIIDSYLIDDK